VLKASYDITKNAIDFFFRFIGGGWGRFVFVGSGCNETRDTFVAGGK